jgi:hypothetical protein
MDMLPVEEERFQMGSAPVPPGFSGTSCNQPIKSRSHGSLSPIISLIAINQDLLVEEDARSDGIGD